MNKKQFQISAWYLCLNQIYIAIPILSNNLKSFGNFSCDSIKLIKPFCSTCISEEYQIESKKATVFVEVLQMQDNLITRQTFTYSKATVEILEELGNMFKVNRKDTRTTSLTSFGCLYCQIWKYFIHFSSAYIVDFEQVNVWRTAFPS